LIPCYYNQLKVEVLVETIEFLNVKFLILIQMKFIVSKLFILRVQMHHEQFITIFAHDFKIIQEY